MKPAPEPIPTEQDVQAYADGLLAAERAPSVLAYLARQPAEARRVAFYARVNAQMRSHFPAQLAIEGAEPAWGGEALRAAELAGAALQPDQPRGLRRGWAGLSRGGRVAAVAVALAVAAGLAACVVAVGLPAFERAAAQRLDTAAYDELTAVTALNAHDIAAAPARPDDASSNPAPNLGAVGFRLADARPLALWPFARAHAFVYRNALGEPLVLVSPGTPERGGRWQARRLGAVRLLEWTSGAGQHIVIAGEARTHGLMKAADLLAGD
ncbi:transcriptional regulator [Burkholderia sp. 3C]